MRPLLATRRPSRRNVGTSAVLVLAALGCGAVPATHASDPPLPEGTRRAVFAGGCFWCLETAFEGQPGVLAVVSGYAGGEGANPRYEDVGSGRTGHYEVVEVAWDPVNTSFEALVGIFWKNVDPTDDGGQFCDRGPQYRTAIFVANDEERRASEATKAEAGRRLGAEIVTPILPATEFWAAEDYHQDFWRKSPVRYESYRRGCRRDARLAELWGPSAH